MHHHPSCPARNGTGGCRCPATKKPQVDNPLKKDKPGKVKPVPKRGPGKR